MDVSEEFVSLQRALSGRFSLERELGRGGMGIVYLARDVALDRPVAIKLLPNARASQPEDRERFLREARTAAQLSHPNIVPIHLVEEKDGLVYFVMAFVDGESLTQRVNRAGPLTPADGARLIQEVAWALAYAHRRGIIHRDIKPDNILIDSGSNRALVADFGIARLTTTGTLSQQGEILGTLQYISPEQASADATIDGRADLYSLGVTAFFALTGRLPFESHSAAELIAMHIAEPAPPVQAVCASVPARLAQAVDRCLAKDPCARFANGEALADAVAEAQLVRREVAPSVLDFLSAVRNATVQVMGLALVALWAAASLWASDVGSTTPLVPVLWLVGVMAGLSCIAPLSAARGVVRAGLGEGDVGEAAASMLLARDANVDRNLEQARRLRAIAARKWVRGGFLALGAVALWKASGGFWNVLENWSYYSAPQGWPALSLSAIQLLLPTGISALCFSVALNPSLVIGVLSGGSPEVAGVVKRFWAGPIGRLLFRVAGVGLRRSESLPAQQPARTEVMLGRAASELFEKLSKDQQARMREVPEVVKRLEQVATGLRVRRDDLASAIAEVGEPSVGTKRVSLVTELEEAKTEAERRLAAAVTALENLRLDLLRLRAGVGRPDDLTDSIERARELGKAIDFELAARQVVASLTNGDAHIRNSRASSQG